MFLPTWLQALGKAGPWTVAVAISVPNWVGQLDMGHKVTGPILPFCHTAGSHPLTVTQARVVFMDRLMQAELAAIGSHLQQERMG